MKKALLILLFPCVVFGQTELEDLAVFANMTAGVNSSVMDSISNAVSDSEALDFDKDSTNELYDDAAIVGRVDVIEQLPSNDITNTQVTNWNDAFGWGDHSTQGYLTNFTETDPIFSAWDKSTGISISESQISDLTHTVDTKLTQSEVNAFESDPIFLNSIAANISAA